MLRALADWVAGGGWEQCTGAFVRLRPGSPESKLLPPLRPKETETMLISLSVETAAVAQWRE